MTTPDESVAARPYSRRSLWVELVIVFAVTLGMSGAFSLLNLIDALLAPVGARLEGAAQVVQVVHLGVHGFLLPAEADRLDRIVAAALEVRRFRDVDVDVAVQ